MHTANKTIVPIALFLLVPVFPFLYLVEKANTLFLINTFGINALCQYLKQFTDKKVVNKYINHISKLDFPKSNEEIEFRDIVMQTINQVEPIKLEYFFPNPSNDKQ